MKINQSYKIVKMNEKTKKCKTIIKNGEILSYEKNNNMSVKNKNIKKLINFL
jgi:hypothetical protein